MMRNIRSVVGLTALFTGFLGAHEAQAQTPQQCLAALESAQTACAACTPFTATCAPICAAPHACAAPKVRRDPRVAGALARLDALGSKIASLDTRIDTIEKRPTGQCDANGVDAEACLQLLMAPYSTSDKAFEVFSDSLNAPEGGPVDPYIYGPRVGRVIIREGRGGLRKTEVIIDRKDGGSGQRYPLILEGQGSNSDGGDKPLNGLLIGGLLGGGVGVAAGCGVGMWADPAEDNAAFYDEGGCATGALIGGAFGFATGALIGWSLGTPDAPMYPTYQSRPAAQGASNLGFGVPW